MVNWRKCPVADSKLIVVQRMMKSITKLFALGCLLVLSSCGEETPLNQPRSAKVLETTLPDAYAKKYKVAAEKFKKTHNEFKDSLQKNIDDMSEAK